MIEPIPPYLLPPTGTEAPFIRVGIVIPEDSIAALTISAHGTSLLSGGGVLPNTIQVKAEGDRLIVDGKTTPNSFKISPQVPFLAPGRGIEVSRVIAGRVFHWRKEISPVFPGSLELHAVNGSLLIINELSLEDYLACVISSEMSKECPLEFMKAQACAARSWAWVFLNNKHPGELFDVCNDDDCQRYQGVTFISQEVIEAVHACHGTFLLRDEYVIPAYYSKCCGGIIESAIDIFGFDVPALQTIPDGELPLSAVQEESDFLTLLNLQNTSAYCSPAIVPRKELARYLGAVDESHDYFRWKSSISADQLVNNIREKFSEPDISEVMGVRPGARSRGGRYKTFFVSSRTNKGRKMTLLLENQYDIRRLFHDSFLYSSAFTHTVHKDSKGSLRAIDFQGLGWGHGVGLCQIGAVGMALSGFGYEKILRHYYCGADLKRVYSPPT